MSKLLPVSSCCCVQLRVRSVLRLRLDRRELAATSRLLKYTVCNEVTGVSDPDPQSGSRLGCSFSDPGFEFNQVSGSVSGSGFRIRIRIQEGKNDPQI
jgi:hypothetical protein